MKRFACVCLTLSLFSFVQAGLAADPLALGSASYAGGDYNEAKKQFIAAVKAKPASWKAQYQLGNTYVQLKDSVNAKKAYQKCITLHPPADTKENCLKAISYLSSNNLNAPPPPQAVAPAAPWHVQQIVPSSYHGSSSASTASTSSSSGSPAAAGNSASDQQKARIMADAEAEVARIKAAGKQELEEAKNNSNQRYIMPDGNVQLGVSNEEESRIARETEAKAAKVMEEARRRVNALAH